jgi:hypothetical protein
MLKYLNMEGSKIGFLFILYGTPPSKDMCSKIKIERDMMEMIPMFDYRIHQ